MDGESPGAVRSRVLSPPERFSEIVFGLIMLLSVTGSMAIASKPTTHDLLVGALGCNLAWGLVDAVMYVVNGLIERGRSRALAQAIGHASTEAAGRALLLSALPELLAKAIDPAEVERLRKKIVDRPASGVVPPGLTRDDLLGATAVLLAVAVSTLPPVLPFLLMDEPTRALRVSSGIALALLALSGAGMGRYAGSSPWKSGLAVLLVGLTLVSAVIALGG